VPLPEITHNPGDVESERLCMRPPDGANVLDDFINEIIVSAVIWLNHVNPPATLLVCKSPVLRSRLPRRRPRCRQIADHGGLQINLGRAGHRAESVAPTGSMAAGPVLPGASSVFRVPARRSIQKDAGTTWEQNRPNTL